MSALRLSVLGIRPWYLRSGTPAEPASPELETVVQPVEQTAVVPAPEIKPSAVDEAVNTDQPTRIEFAWYAGQAGMLLVGRHHPLVARFARDILNYLDWQVLHDATDSVETKGKFTQGEFKWPQLTPGQGSPQRALAAFVETYLPRGAKWIGICEPVTDLSPWLDSALQITKLADPAVILPDASAKKALWLQLQNPA